jgi:hypothetical protein
MVLKKGNGEEGLATIRVILAYLVAVAVTAVLAVALHSQFVMAGLRSLGAEIGAAETLRVTAHDIAGMAPLYALFIAVALALGFLITRMVRIWVHLTPRVSYAIGGAAAIGLMMVIMRVVLGITVVAGARTPGGFAAQCAVGAIGGLVFALLYRQAGRATPR